MTRCQPCWIFFTHTYYSQSYEGKWQAGSHFPPWVWFQASAGLNFQFTSQPLNLSIFQCEARRSKQTTHDFTVYVRSRLHYMGKWQWSKPNNLYYQWYAKVWTSTLEVGGDGSHMTAAHYEFTYDLGYIGGLFPGPSHLVSSPDPTTSHKEKRSGEPTRISWASKWFCDSVT